MVKREGSKTQSPSPISPSMSSSSVEDAATPSPNSEQPTVSASRTGSASDEQKEAPIHDDDTVTCMWEDCGIVFTHMPTLIDHIHNVHIGVHKSSYTCEWSTCLRKGLSQTSRFALISHVRSHTGEKPFTCPLPECDKSFTRSDALAKHMRLQHNISPPAPGRGGSRKRKHPFDEPIIIQSPLMTSPPPHTMGFSTFKVEPGTNTEPLQESGPSNGLPLHDPSHHSIQQERPQINQLYYPDEDDGYNSSSSDSLPSYLLKHFKPTTNLIMGRSPAMVRYILVKSRYKYALEQQEQLNQELQTARAELSMERDKKDEAMDRVLRGTFGSEAEKFIAPIPMPPSMFTPSISSPDTFANGHDE